MFLIIKERGRREGQSDRPWPNKFCFILISDLPSLRMRDISF